MIRVLHAGCGCDPLPDWLGDCEEVRLDIDPACEPDIVASMTDLGDIGLFDAVVCQHALEHLPAEDVGKALSEFQRVLKPGGFLFLAVPDTEGVEPTDAVLFVSPAGPISGRDLFFGLGTALADHPHMAHHTQFVAATLEQAMREAEFDRVAARRVAPYNLLAAGVKH